MNFVAFQTFQLVVGMASANKIGQEFRSTAPFASFDVLTPEEPGRVWQLTKRLLSISHNFLASYSVQKTSNVAKPGVQFPVQ